MTAGHAQSTAATEIPADRSACGGITVADDVAALTLDDRGMVCDCNSAVAALFKYRRSELVWRHISMLLPQLADLDLMPNGEPNSHLRFLCRIGRSFQAVSSDGKSFSGELFLNVLNNPGRGRLSLIVRPVAEVTEERGQPTRGE